MNIKKGGVRFLAHRILRHINIVYYGHFREGHFREKGVNPKGADILSRDWDNLILLDNCRFDFFEKYSELPGELTKVESKGSNTFEWMKGNFEDRDLQDTIYITAASKILNHKDEINASFYKIYNLWSDEAYKYTVWKDVSIVEPDSLVKKAVEVEEAHPDKRLIIHFLQPHTPFIEPAHEELKTTNNIPKKKIAKEINVPKSDIIKSYIKNLKIILPFTNELLDTLDGKTVVTSDHGEMFGERSGPIPIKEWGHPRGLYSKQLIEVPWLEHQNGERKRISDSKIERDKSPDITDEEIEENLKVLGYID